jgi:hypothetical protein
MDELNVYYVLIRLLRELVLINFYALVGQGLLFVLAGQGREQNAFYRIVKIIASPAVWLARRITPRFVEDRHVPWVALLILMVLVVGLTVAQQIVLGQLMEQAGTR